jgi:hypothetical protein
VGYALILGAVKSCFEYGCKSVVMSEHEDRIKLVNERVNSRGQSSIITGNSSSVTSKEVTAQNNELFDFLWDKGYWAKKIGDNKETHYIIVSAVAPKDTDPFEDATEDTASQNKPDHKGNEEIERLMLDILDKNILLNNPKIPLEEVRKRLREAGFNF